MTSETDSLNRLQPQVLAELAAVHAHEPDVLAANGSRLLAFVQVGSSFACSGTQKC
jgi:hypothetical protein